MASLFLPRPVDILPFPLSQLWDLDCASGPLSAQLRQGASQIKLTGVAQASNKVHPGDLYVALPGSRCHGAEFAQDAVHAGAVAVMTDAAGAQILTGQAVKRADWVWLEAPLLGVPLVVVENPRGVVGEVASAVYGNPSAQVPVVGVTGTNGKTTIAYLLTAALRAVGHVVATVGTVEVRIGDRVWPAERTTPEASDLQALCAYALEQGATAIVLEASSHGFSLGRLAGVRFSEGIFTNLTADHLDLHGSMEEYFAAKQQLFQDPEMVRILNVDDAYGQRLARASFAPVTFSLKDPHASWYATEVTPEGASQRFTLTTPGGEKKAASVNLPGRFNVSNALAAIAAAVRLGVPLHTAIYGVAHARGVPGRMERVFAARGEDNGVVCVVDYAHAPDGVVKALEALREGTPGRLFCVLGCGGDRDAFKRPLMGEAAARLSDVFVATDDNPRSENPDDIRAAMLAGVSQIADNEKAEIVEIADRAEAISWAVKSARAGDTVAVLGKGHEQGQEVAGVVHPFDDRVVVATALEGVSR